MNYSQEVVDYLHEGDFAHMHVALKQAILHDADDVLADLAEYLQMMGFLEESQQVYDHLLENNSDGSAYFLNLAELAEANGNIDLALNYLYQIAPSDTDNYVAALVKIADLYESEDDFETAISKLEEASSLSDDPLVTFALAESYFANGDFSEAIRNYAKLSERQILHSTKISIYERIGESYAQLSNFENAVAFLEKSNEYDKKLETTYKIALLYAEMGELTRALSNFKSIDKEAPEELSYELAYAQALLEDGQSDLALEIAKKGIQKFPDNVALLHFASQLSYQKGDADAAERFLLEALNQPSLHDETIFRLANLYYNQDDFEAVVHLQDLLEDEHLLASWLFAQANRALENDAQAQSLYATLADSELAQNPEFLSDYIDFLREIGQVKAAEPVIKQYLALAPDDEAMRDLLTDSDEAFLGTMDSDEF